ncbi:hypothetical protein KSP39_PZI019316 [Platanthera zijinensis]|uniref:Glyoxal oxidase n=1 Tax=Platanthera zijinensis TaxID=2320716 RepID=A0AAP0B147_9ASPA
MIHALFFFLILFFLFFYKTSSKISPISVSLSLSLSLTLWPSKQNNMNSATYPTISVGLLLLLTLHFLLPMVAESYGGRESGLGGSWELLLNSSGVVVMHMALTHLNTVIFYDQTSSGRTGYLLHPNRTCSAAAGGGNSSEGNDEGNSTNSMSSVDDCWAHSMAYDVATNSLRPLSLRTDTWCSSGSFLGNGTLRQTGGYGSGIRKIRFLQPCSDFSCDWTESPTPLADDRWYATSQILPDGGTDGANRPISHSTSSPLSLSQLSIARLRRPPASLACAARLRRPFAHNHSPHFTSSPLSHLSNHQPDVARLIADVARLLADVARLQTFYWLVCLGFVSDTDIGIDGADRVFILGGLNTFTYEFVPKSHSDEAAYDLPFLRQTRESTEKGNNLYPFVHLSSDGNLFIFANRDSILFDYRRNAVVRTFPRIPDTGARNYPSTGSSVILPLHHSDGFHRVEVMICGGAAAGAYQASRRGEYRRALSSCGRMVITEDFPEWTMEEMPGPRLMSDMLVLPTGDIFIINGATAGCAGWQSSINPVLSPYLYSPNGIPGERFSILPASNIPRMYHSAALLLPDGRILVGGSNPYYRYNFSGYPYPTELRMEAFTPYYLSEIFDGRRAMNVMVTGEGEAGIRYGEEFVVTFDIAFSSAVVEFVASAAPFVTHSLSMHQRVLRLGCREMEGVVEGTVRATVSAPPSPIAAPPGYYMLTVVNGGIPSKSIWVRFTF